MAVTAVFVLLSASALSQEKRVNAIVSLKAVNSGQTYEVTITSEEPFLRSDLPVLRIGDQEITISRARAPDQHYAQTFLLTAEQYGKVKSGDRVAFQWGSGEGRRQLEMGTLDKSRLNK
jgi:hypothetical protein